MLYIAATIEDLKETAGLNCFSIPALEAILDYYDEAGYDQELDAAELRGEWEEHEDANSVWWAYRRHDPRLPEFYDPDQMEALTDAIESAGHMVMQLENGGWLVKL